MLLRKHDSAQKQDNRYRSTSISIFFFKFYLNKTLIKVSLKQIFYVDPRGIHWPAYIENYLIGTKKYLLNEDLHGVPAAKQHLKILRNIRWCTNLIIAVLFWRLLIAKSQPARNLWYLVLNMAAKFVRFFRISSTMQPMIKQ